MRARVCAFACESVEVLQPWSCHRLAPQSGIRVPTCKLPSRLRSRCPAMTESPATKRAGGRGDERARNGLKPERNGSLKSLRCKHELQPTHYCQPEEEEEEEVRPGMGRERLGGASAPRTRKMLHCIGVVLSWSALTFTAHLKHCAANVIKNIPVFESKMWGLVGFFFSFQSCMVKFSQINS